MLLAGALLAPLGAAAQTTPADRATDADAAAEPNPQQRSMNGARNEPIGTENPRANASDVGDTSRFEKNKTQLNDDITDLKKRIEVLRANTTEQGREKLNALSSRVDGLQNRVVTAEDSERDFDENKHKFTNEVKRIRRELRDVKRYRTIKSEPAPMEGYP
jgi:predicted  nucleic acid-binding Zn-ribbon protein